jgi:hypothetical protein
MNSERIRMWILCCSLVLAFQLQGLAQQNSSNASTQPSLRDGQHDFDFEFGTWKTHLSRLVHPLTGSKNWVEYDGTTVVRKLWDGRANMVELVADGPAGHFEGLNLRLYNADAHQWNLNFANSGDGVVTTPTIGEFHNGRGEFYDQELLNGRAIFVRFVISDITPDSCRFEQAFSTDGGKTWEVNWIAKDTRVKDGAGIPGDDAPPTPGLSQASHLPTQHDGQRDFDFEEGTWKIHLARLKNPLTGSKTWIQFDGDTVTRKIWGGRGFIEEFETDSPTGHIEGLTLRLYNPQSKQWSLYWANSKQGMMGGPPNIGEFRNGRGEFYCWDTYNGRYILDRYVWSDITTNTAHFEQSYSDDGGKTWEANWITDQTRVKE